MPRHFLILICLMALLVGCGTTHNIHYQSHRTQGAGNVELAGTGAFDPVLSAGHAGGRFAFGIAPKLDFQAFGDGAWYLRSRFNYPNAEKIDPIGYSAGMGLKWQVAENLSLVAEGGKFFTRDTVESITEVWDPNLNMLVAIDTNLEERTPSFLFGNLKLFVGDRLNEKVEFTSQTLLGIRQSSTLYEENGVIREYTYRSTKFGQTFIFSLSNDLDKWAIRTGIGMERDYFWTLTLGLGFSVNLNSLGN